LSFFSLKRRPVLIKSTLAVFVTFVVIGGYSLRYLQISNEQRNARLVAEASRVLELVVEHLHQNLSELRRDLLALSQSSEVKSFDPADPKPLNRSLLAFAKVKKRYDQIRLLDLNGNEKLRIDHQGDEPRVIEKKDLQNKRNRYYFKQSLNLAPLDVYISPLDLNVEKGEIEIPYKPMIRLATAWNSVQGTRLGVLVLNYKSQDLLQLINDHENGSLYKLLLVNQQGYYLKGRIPSEEWGFMIPQRKSENFALHFPQTWAQMQFKHQGSRLEQGDLLAYKDQLSVTTADLGALSNIRAIAWMPKQRIAAIAQKEASRVYALAGLVFGLLSFLEIWLIRHREHRRVAESQLHNLRQDLVNSQETQRQRISYELHDGLAPLLSAIHIQISLLERKHPSQDQSQLNLTKMIQDSIAQVRVLAYELAPPDLEMQDFEEVITELCHEFRQLHSVQLDLCYSLEVEPDSQRATHLYRVLQEALRNIANHAQATQVDVILKYQKEQLILEVLDNGVGYDLNQLKKPSNKGQQLGVKGMIGRAAMIEGTCEIKSAPGQGTQISVKVPLETHSLGR